MAKMNYANAATRNQRMAGRLENMLDKACAIQPIKKSKSTVVDPCSCGSIAMTVEDGKGPHKFKLVCAECGKHQRWLKTPYFFSQSINTCEDYCLP